MSVRIMPGSITAKLVLAFFLAFLPMAWLEYTEYCERQTDLLATVREARIAHTQNAVRAVEQYLSRIILGLEVTLRDLNNTSDPASVRTALQSVIARCSGCIAAGLIDPESGIFYRYPQLNPGEREINLPPASQRSVPAVSSVSQLGGMKVFAVTVPLPKKGPKPGVLYAVVSADSLIASLRNAVGEGHGFILLDREYKGVSQTGIKHELQHFSRLISTQTLSPDQISEFRVGNLPGCAAVSPTSGWHVVFLDKDADLLRHSLPVLPVLMLFVTFVMVFVIGNKIASPIRKLSRAAVAVAVGDLRRRVRINTGDELQSLADCFNNMADSLEEQQRTLQKISQSQQSLLDLARTITGSLDLDVVAVTISEALKQQFGAEQAFIFRREELTGALVPIITDSSEHETAKALTPIVEHVVDSPVTASEISHVAYPGSEQNDMTVISLPLIAEGSPVGVLAIILPEDTYLQLCSGNQMYFLRTFASYAAIAVHNAYIHGRTEELISMLDSLRRVDEAISSSLDLNQVLKSLVKITAEVMGAKSCAILLMDNHKRLSVVESYNMSKELCNALVFKPGEKWSGVVFSEAKPVSRRDVASEDDVKPRHVLAKEGLHGFISAPLIAGEEVIGTINVWMAKPHDAKQTEIDLLTAVASHAAVVIGNARMFGKEYLIAETLQDTLLVKVPESYGRLVFGHKYLPALEDSRVGGDLYDVIPLPNGKVALIVADITGKGIQAAVHTAMIRYLTRAFLFQWPDSPAAVMDLLNRAINSYFDTKIIVTVFCAIIDHEGGWMSYTNAGHPPAIVLTKGGKQQIFLYRTGLPIGCSNDSDYQEHEIMLSAKDMLILYTDGIIEARRDGVVLSVDGLQDIVFNNVGLGPKEMVEAICKETRDYADGNIGDDIAIIAATLESYEEQVIREMSEQKEMMK